MTFDHPLWRTFPIVTPDKFEMGLHGMRVPGGYVFWWCPAGGAYLQRFVAMDAITADPLCGARKATTALEASRVFSVPPGMTVVLAEDMPGGVGNVDASEAPSDTE